MSDLYEIISKIRKITGKPELEIPPDLRDAELKVRELKKRIQLARMEGKPEEEIAPMMGELAAAEYRLRTLLAKLMGKGP
jgi:hypothetical protein